MQSAVLASVWNKPAALFPDSWFGEISYNVWQAVKCVGRDETELQSRKRTLKPSATLNQASRRVIKTSSAKGSVRGVSRLICLIFLTKLSPLLWFNSSSWDLLANLLAWILLSHYTKSLLTQFSISLPCQSDCLLVLFQSFFLEQFGLGILIIRYFKKTAINSLLSVEDCGSAVVVNHRSCEKKACKCCHFCKGSPLIRHLSNL